MILGELYRRSFYFLALWKSRIMQSNVRKEYSYWLSSLFCMTWDFLIWLLNSVISQLTSNYPNFPVRINLLLVWFISAKSKNGFFQISATALIRCSIWTVFWWTGWMELKSLWNEPSIGPREFRTSLILKFSPIFPPSFVLSNLHNLIILEYYREVDLY